MSERLRQEFSGRVVTGRGEAAGFTHLDWVRRGFMAYTGIDPFAGTLNLIVEAPHDLEAWAALRASRRFCLEAPTAAFCRGWCYPVLANASIAAAIVVPDVPNYPAWQVELVAAVPLRATLGVADGDRVDVVSTERLTADAVIFDVDGTLVDSLTAFRVVAERAAAIVANRGELPVPRRAASGPHVVAPAAVFVGPDLRTRAADSAGHQGGVLTNAMSDR